LLNTWEFPLANHSFGKKNCCERQNQAPICEKEQEKVNLLLDEIGKGEKADEESKTHGLPVVKPQANPPKAQLPKAQAALAACRERQCPKTDDCNKPGWPELDFVGVKASETTAALSWNNLKEQLFCNQNQMGYAYGTPGVVGHVVVINGYTIGDHTNYLQVYDPWYPCIGHSRLITYAEYGKPAGTATHWNTWFNIAKK
jgi:hypothetical protein